MLSNKIEKSSSSIEKTDDFLCKIYSKYYYEYRIWHLKMAKNTSSLYHNRAQILGGVSPIQTAERFIPHLIREIKSCALLSSRWDRYVRSDCVAFGCIFDWAHEQLVSGNKNIHIDDLCAIHKLQAACQKSLFTTALMERVWPGPASLALRAIYLQGS